MTIRRSEFILKWIVISFFFDFILSFPGSFSLCFFSVLYVFNFYLFRSFFRHILFSSLSLFLYSVCFFLSSFKFTLRSLDPSGKGPRFPLDRMLIGPLSRFGSSDKVRLLPFFISEIIGQLSIRFGIWCLHQNLSCEFIWFASIEYNPHFSWYSYLTLWIFGKDCRPAVTYRSFVWNMLRCGEYVTKHMEWSIISAALSSLQL